MLLEKNIFIVSNTFLIFSSLVLIALYTTIIIFFTLKNRTFFPVFLFFILVIIIASIKYYYFDLFSDENFYFNSALSQLPILGEYGTSPLLTPESKTSFTTINVFLFNLIGVHPFYGLLLNAIATSAAHLALMKACGNFKIEAKPLTVAWIFFLFPQLLLFTPWFLREALAIFLLSLTVFASSYMYVGYLKFSLFLYFLIFPALYFTRGQLIIIAAISLAVSLIYFYRNNISVKNLFKAFIIFAFSLLFIFLNQSTFSYIRNLNSTYFTNLIQGNSASPNRTVPPYTGEEFNYSPLGFLYNLFRSIIGPFPWEWKNLSWVALGFDGLFFLALASLVLYNFVK